MTRARETSENARQAKAWANFDGTFSTSPYTEANGGIRDSFNVSSVTDEGAGLYTVNFETAFANNNWVMSTSGKFSQYNNTDMPVINLDRKVADNVAMTTSSARIACCSVTASPSLFPYVNAEFVFAIFFGEQ